MNNNQRQQGDVLLKQVNSLPSKVKQIERKGNRFVLAEGEMTGHIHEVEAEQFIESDGKKFLVGQVSPLVHEEHDFLPPEPGIWQVGQVVEKDWLSGMVNPVRD